MAVTYAHIALELPGINLAEQLTTAILVLDPQLQVSRFNTACCALLGIG
jgi:two-component system nitrogen regulation sensor histidine kinase GlnL